MAASPLAGLPLMVVNDPPANTVVPCTASANTELFACGAQLVGVPFGLNAARFWRLNTCPWRSKTWVKLPPTYVTPFTITIARTRPLVPPSFFDFCEIDAAAPVGAASSSSIANPAASSLRCMKEPPLWNVPLTCYPHQDGGNRRRAVEHATTAVNGRVWGRERAGAPKSSGS